jgi:hypothetical protein
MSNSSSSHPPHLNYDASDEETPPTFPATTISTSTIADSLQSIPLPHLPPNPIIIPDPNLPPPPSPPPAPPAQDPLFPGLPLRYHILNFHNLLNMRERVEEEAEEARARFGVEVLNFYIYDSFTFTIVLYLFNVFTHF